MLFSFPSQIDRTEESFFVDINQLDEFCREKKIVDWFETSAKEGTGIYEAYRVLVHKVNNNLYGMHACTTWVEAWSTVLSTSGPRPLVDHKIFTYSAPSL